MPLPEGYLPREGDVLILHGVVKHDVKPSEDEDSDNELNVWVRLLEDYTNRRVKLRTVIGMHARKWNVGDQVVLPGSTLTPLERGTVLATDDDGWCWVKFAGEPGTYLANLLEAAPPEPSRENMEAVAGIEPAPQPPPPPPLPKSPSGDIEEIEF